jgi:hypothetical protein
MMGGQMPNRVSEYFASRAVAEETMSGFATDPRVAAAHAEMAERYEALAVEFDINRPDGFRPAAPPEAPAP